MAVIPNDIDDVFVYKDVQTLIGKLRLIGNDEGLAAIEWATTAPGKAKYIMKGEDRNHPVLLEAERQLREYFDGRRKVFELRMNFVGLPFQ